MSVTMNGSMSEKIRAIVPTQRARLDTTKVRTIDTDIKNSCTELTMDTLKKLEKVADPITYPNVARYMMMIASLSPMKCICVGISPYENGILPTFAAAMAYSPMTCVGCTPSVQVLSQAMSLVAIKIKNVFMSKKKDRERYKLLTRDEYVAKFAMMIRCSYSCLMTGVAFINASPVITSNTAKRVRAASIFSEWIGNMIEIHSRNQYKLTIVAMGALAESTMNDVFKSFEGAKSNVSYTKTSNPAMLQHMNVTKEPDPTPISNDITEQEQQLDEIMGCNPGRIVKSRFQWYTYSDDLLLTVVKETSIMQMTRLLVDAAPEQLLGSFLNKITDLITNSNMDMNELMGGLGGFSLGENVPGGDNSSTAGGFNPFDNQNTQRQAGTETTQQEHVPVNPFLPVINQMNTGPETQANTGANPNAETSQGPPMVTRKSTIGQLLDPTGKAVSQHVIVLDSMIRSLTDLMSGYKELTGDLDQFLVRQANIYVKLQEHRVRNEEEIADLNEYLQSFREMTDRIMGDMTKAYGVVAAIPAVVEGDRGVYEHESHPVGPLMRRADGSTMKDYVYTQMKENAERSEQINSFMNNRAGSQTQSVAGDRPTVNTSMGNITSPPMSAGVSATPTQNMNAGGFNPFAPLLGGTPTQTQPEIVDLSTTGDANMLQQAKEFVYECADEMLDEIPEGERTLRELLSDADGSHWNNLTFAGIYAEVIALEHRIPVAKGRMNVLDCLSLVVAEYMSINSGEKPDEKVMKNVFTLLNTDDEERAGFLKMLPNWIKSSTSAMEMMTLMNEDMDEESGSDESEDESE